jgi:DNA-binding cell septation regulator SpoVG
MTAALLAYQGLSRASSSRLQSVQAGGLGGCARVWWGSRALWLLPPKAIRSHFPSRVSRSCNQAAQSAWVAVPASILPTIAARSAGDNFAPALLPWRRNSRNGRAWQAGRAGRDRRAMTAAGMLIQKLVPHIAGQMLAFLTIGLSSGLIINDCRLMNGRRGLWIALPSRPQLERAPRRERAPVKKTTGHAERPATLFFHRRRASL